MRAAVRKMRRRQRHTRRMLRKMNHPDRVARRVKELADAEADAAVVGQDSGSPSRLRWSPGVEQQQWQRESEALEKGRLAMGRHRRELAAAAVRQRRAEEAEHDVLDTNARGAADLEREQVVQLGFS